MYNRLLYYIHFLEENISVDPLKILNAEHLHDLTRKWKIGDKATFSHNFQLWSEENSLPYVPSKENKENVTPVASPVVFSSKSLVEDNSIFVSLDSILSSSQIGIKLKNECKKKQILSDEQRSALIKLIAQHFDKNCIKMCL